MRLPLLSLFFPSLLWRVPTKEKVIYLTFDDGPVPGVTPWVLELLEQYHAKATFFCVGENVKKHPDIYKSVLEKGHVTGNHTLSHLNAWNVPAAEYMGDVHHAATVIQSDLFRPPYGRITPQLIRKLKNTYKIVMWDVLSMDYDSTLDPEACISRIRNKAKSGSIIVFHDSIKAEKRLKEALPFTLRYFAEQGFRFESLNSK